MARRTSWRKAARPAQRNRNHSAKSTFGRSLYRRPLRLELLEDRRLLALVTVTTLEDSVNFNDGVTSLREAIFAANSLEGADSIDFAPGLTASGPATILMTQGEFEITEEVTIAGPGAGLLTVDAQLQSRVLNITATSGDVELSGLTVRNGRGGSGGGIQSLTAGTIRLDQMVVESNRADFRGGGVYAVGLISIHNSAVLNNLAGSFGTALGGGIYAAAGIEASGATIEGNGVEFGSGGGIFVAQSATTLQISDCVIRGNEASRNGGGLYGFLVSVGAPTIVNSEIGGNTAELGGGIFFDRGDLRIDSSVLANNSAERGGAIYADNSSHVVVTNCEVSANEAFIGGGIAGRATVTGSTFFGNRANSDGGALAGGIFQIFDSTLSGNSAEDEGGAIAASGPVTITRSTIADNLAGKRGGGIRTKNILLQDSIVATNHAGISGPDIYQYAPPEESSARYSVISDGSGTYFAESPTGTPDADGNLIGGPTQGVIDVKLGPLTYNGGFKLPGSPYLRTHALLSGSPAINAGDPNSMAGEGGVPGFDQRGESHARVVGGRIDIGAYELQPAVQLDLIVDTLVDDFDGDYSAGDLSLREAIELTNASNFDGVVDTVAFDPALFEGSNAGTILLTLGALVITDTVEIEGPGSSLLTVDASGSDSTPDEGNGDGSQVFVVDDLNESSFIDVSISGLTIRGGDSTYGGGILSAEHLTISDGRIIENYSATLGGGVFSVGGNLTISDSTISGNRAGADGGGVANFYGNFTLTESTLSGNAARSGGGLYTSGGTATIERSRIATNSASPEIGVGGGIQATTSDVVIRHSIVTGNSARDAGGIYSGYLLELIDSAVNQNTATRNGAGLSSHGELRMENTTVSGNRAGGSGGGIWAMAAVEIENSTIARNSAAESGGGAWLEVDVEPISLLQVTVSGNQATGPGAGLWINDRDAAAGGPIDIRHSTIAMNEATGAGIGGGIFLTQGAVALDHTIVAKNSASIAQDLAGLIGGLFTARYSLIGDNTGSGLTATSIVPDTNGNFIGNGSGLVDPALSELAYHGGRTPTHALQTFNPTGLALNAGDFTAMAGTGSIPTHDQRGAPYARVSGGRIDIGSFESSPSTLLAGDYSRNGIVDALDYVIWRNQYGTNVAPGTGADGNGDGGVDDFDYAVWKLNFGMTAGGQGSSFGVAEDLGRTEQGVAQGLVSLVPQRQAEPPAEPGAEGLLRMAMQIGETGRQPPALPGVRGRFAESSREKTPVLRDRVLAAWLSQRSVAIQDDASPASSVSGPDASGAAIVDAACDQLDEFAIHPRRSRGLRDARVW